ncbi:TIGR03032 family protein [Rhodobacterales bacterium]|nr:TIGR03032 family protein [Rhodobacterales bacterium]
MSESSSEARPRTAEPILAGDGVGVKDDTPFHVTYSSGLVGWMQQSGASLAFTTYTKGKVVIIGPGLTGNVAVSERNFGHAMAMRPTEKGLYLSTRHQVWLFENGLEPGTQLDGWDRIYMPRGCDVTGAVDIHDIHIDAKGRLLVAVTLYNCLAELDGKGSFSPIWRPSFITEIANEDRCHFNGFCLEDGEAAYATVIGESNVAGGWRDMRADGGMVIDMRTDTVISRGLAMPHTPRLYRGELYVLEGGSGWLGRIDRTTGAFERIAWCPGFLRGLSFCGDFAVISLSKPRNEVFSGLPLDGELKERDRAPECAVYVVRLSDGEVCHTLTITGSVEELYDTAVLAGTYQPLLVGLEGDEIGKYIAVGPDRSGGNNPGCASVHETRNTSI